MHLPVNSIIGPLDDICHWSTIPEGDWHMITYAYCRRWSYFKFGKKGRLLQKQPSFDINYEELLLDISQHFKYVMPLARYPKNVEVDEYTRLRYQFAHIHEGLQYSSRWMWRARDQTMKKEARRLLTSAASRGVKELKNVRLRMRNHRARAHTHI